MHLRNDNKIFYNNILSVIFTQFKIKKLNNRKNGNFFKHMHNSLCNLYFKCTIKKANLINVNDMQ